MTTPEHVLAKIVQILQRMLGLPMVGCCTIVGYAGWRGMPILAHWTIAHTCALTLQRLRDR